MAASSSISSMGEAYVLPSTNSSKPYQYLVEIIGLDHNYCRPWSEREKIPHVRPAKNLFSPQSENETERQAEESKKSEEKKSKPENEIIDVDTVDEAPLHGPAAVSMQYDVMKSKIVMSECEKYVSSASSKRTPDTWEELICRTGWTTQQNVLFDKILKIVSAYRLSWLTYQGSTNEPILRRVAVDKATKRVRQILSRIEWDTKLTTWLHSSMVDGLSIPLLACYLDIIQTLRSKVPTLVDKMVAGGTTNRRVSAGTTDNLTALLKRPWDATVALTSFQRPRKITGTPLLLIVPGGPTTGATGNSTKRSRFWHHHLSHFGKVIPVTMHLSNSGRGVSIGQCLDHMIGAVQAKVLELKNHFPNRPVVLIGWATGALVSFQVSLKESVCAVVCLGFPLLGVDGMRGGAGDSFLDSKAPTMFVFGSLSTSCSLPDIEEFRTKLLADTSLLVIGGADDQLRLTSAKKKKEGVTQSVVDRRIMDDIGEFLNQAVSSMNDDSHPRLDYFDFDDVENRRKKPKSEYRKRPAGADTGSATAPKKPRGRTPKANNGEGNVPKKPKVVKAVKKIPASKSAANVPGTGSTSQAPGVPAVRPTGGVPIAPLRGAHPTIPSGIIQGVPLTSVSVPISAVGVPLTGVPVSRVSIPGVRLSGVNIPVSAVNVPVSAVIKQGSLGGRSFVFPGTVSASTNSGVTTSGITTMGTSGNTHHLKIVVNPSVDGGIKLAGPPKSGVSCESQATMQYKTAIVTAPLPTKSPTPVKTTCENSTTQTSTATTQLTSVTSKPITSAVMTSSGPTSRPPATPSTAGGVSQVTSTASSKPNVASRTVVTVPKSAVISGPAQFVMHQGQLSAIGKQPSVRSSSPGNPPPSTQQKVAPQGTRVNTTAGTKPQTTVSTAASKQPTVRVSHVGSAQSSTNLVKKSPTPQSMARTIQVGVKRTVTYNPSTPSKNVTVVSRTIPSEALTTHVPNVSQISIERLKAKLKTIQSMTGQIGTVEMKTSQTLTNPASRTVQNIKSDGSSALSTTKLITQAGAHSPAQSSASTSVQGNSKSSAATSVHSNVKSSAQAVTMSTAQTTTKSVTQSQALTTASTTPKASAKTDESSAQTSLTSARPPATVAEKLETQSSAKSSTQLTQSTAPTAGKLEQSTRVSGSQVTARPSVMSTVKPTTHFIQVPASAKSSAQSTAKLTAQTSSSQNIQGTTQASAQSTPSSSTTPRATNTIARATSVTSHATSTSTTATLTQKEDTSGKGAAKSADVNTDQSGSSSASDLKSDEEKLAEKINDIVKEVVGGKQRTTRQSVRRLVAAAKMAEEQHKRKESSEGNKDLNTKSK